MRRIRWYVQARLHRRLFLWFGASILATGLAVAVVLHLTAGDSWRRSYENAKNFVSGQFAESWSDPARREAIAKAISRDFEAGVIVEDPSGKVLSSHGERCRF